ncbi:M55 family metallopeptidase [Anaerobranca gottschalkii]|uniref:D-aminopeptidase DppA. Metallo peptidase. MEROPS family M55 n=1 Tax=Anaerobranca gottschalkii DSM 13577 TaxID=1120990 RepID=A0A1I0AVX6_9FIRM|nr:M55 family metallopeptidase [Anaerobranca gottschalkii]SES98132.1 D-aminopeptidase DppA. Metallo peptidase. MEROPS family M55 [Anaerobranca gottschalkii DSM 13577]
MKVYISADIEGIWGVVSRKQIIGDDGDYLRARKLMTKEVNLVCQELFNNGVKEIVVNDSHGPMDNIIIEELHPDVSLISGYPKDLSMMAGIDETFDCAIFIGYHPKAGTEQGIFDHTYAGRVVSKLIINGEELGEAGLNAGVAGHFNVPVVLVSGDDKVCKAVLNEIGPIQTVAVKETISRYCAKNIPYNQLKNRYKEAVHKAITELKKYPIKKFTTPLILELEFTQAIMVDMALTLPQVKKVSAKRILVNCNDPVELYKIFRGIINLASTVL